jgi:hypothetical protein
MVRSIAVEPKGQYLVSGSDDLTVKGRNSPISLLQIYTMSITVLILLSFITRAVLAQLV